MSQAKNAPTTGPVARAIQAVRSDLRLVSDNPKTEEWSDRPKNTLVTFTLPQDTVDGAYHGVRNLLWANARMMQAIEAVRIGDHDEARMNIDRAIGELVSANTFAETLYKAIRRSARRTNRKGARA